MPLDFAHFPLEGSEWDEFWYGSRLDLCRSDLEREFFQSQELVRNEVIQRLPDDQLRQLDVARLSAYCRLAVARRYGAEGRHEPAEALIDQVLQDRLDHPLIDYPALFRQAIEAHRARSDFASAIALQRDYLSWVSEHQGPDAARTLAMDLAQLVAESGDETRGAFIFQEWFGTDPERLAESNKALIQSIRPELLAETAREIGQGIAEARLEGDDERLKLYRDLMQG